MFGEKLRSRREVSEQARNSEEFDPRCPVSGVSQSHLCGPASTYFCGGTYTHLRSSSSGEVKLRSFFFGTQCTRSSARSTMVALSPLALCFALPAALNGGRISGSSNPCSYSDHSHEASRTTRRLVITRSADILPTVREGIAEAGGSEEWDKSVAVLSEAMGVDSEEAERILADALGWRAWAAANEKFRRFQKPVAPDTAKLEESIAWLKDGPLKLDQGQLVAAVSTSPKVYLQCPDVAYRKAKGAAPKKFADTFDELALKDPSVMECYHNCSDDGCASECGNCWVSYEMRN